MRSATKCVANYNIILMELVIVTLIKSQGLDKSTCMCDSFLALAA